MARNSNGQSALVKHLRVLDAFDPWHPSLTCTQIAETSGIPKSTTHRLLVELVREGLVEELPDRTYRLGVRLWELGSRTPGALGVKEVARPWLTAVHERVGQHAQLGVLSGLDVLFVDRISAADAIVCATLIGGRLPLHASSAGLVLLAGADNAGLLSRIARQGMEPLTPAGIGDGAQLRAAVRQVAADGFAVTSGHVYPGSRGIAVPVKGPLGDVYAAMGVVIPSGATPVRPVVDILQWAAARTTQALADLHAAAPDEEIPARGAPVYSGVSSQSLCFLTASARRRRPGHHSQPTARLEHETVRDHSGFWFLVSGFWFLVSGSCGNAAPPQKTMVVLPSRAMRSSQCQRTARDSTARSTSAPRRTRSSVVFPWSTRTTSCSMIGPSSRSAVT
jgi:DNA-binding IclR family transcriptional regulator